MKHKRLALLTQGALIAALYTALTYLINYFGLANGAIQVRISEALTILPVFTPAAIPGLFIGCLLSNLLTGAAIWDIVFGSLAYWVLFLPIYCVNMKSWLRFRRFSAIRSSFPLYLSGPMASQMRFLIYF